MNQKTWTLVAATAGIVAGFAARRATARAWEHATDSPVPLKKPDPRLSRLLLFTALSAAIAAVASASAKLGVHALTGPDEDPDTA